MTTITLYLLLLVLSLKYINIIREKEKKNMKEKRNKKEYKNKN
jgi:preprotein translocase subunit SecG